LGGGIGLLSLTSCSKNIDVPLKVEDYLKDHKHLLPAPIGVNPGDWDTVTNTNMLAYFNTNLDVQNLFNGILNEQYVENDDFFKQDFFKVNKFNINDNDEQPCNKSITISGKLTKDDPDGKNGFAGDKFNRFQSCGFNNASYY
jgi:hypothetical protein